MKKIFWITSYPKSGNTWMRAILCGLFFSKEGLFDFNLLKYIMNFDHPSKYDFVKKININDYNRMHKLSVICKYWVEAQKRAEVGGDFAFFKTHSANVTLNKFPYTTADTTLGLIHLIRDPRDVAVSYSKHYRISIEKTLDNMESKNLISWTGIPKKNPYPILTSSWETHYQTWKMLDVPKLVIKYENLLKDTKNTIYLIIEFFSKSYGFKFNNIETLISNIIKTTNFNAFKNHEKKHGFAEAPYFYKKNEIAEYFFRKGQDNQWKKELTKNQRNRIEISFKQIMRELNYL